MPAIVEFPEVIQEAMPHFADLFANEPQRQHLAEYLTGLIVAQRKTVSGIQREFADAADQSCLNRFLNAVDWDVEALNSKRLELMQQDERTRYHDEGAIALDNVLIDHDGKLIEDVGYFWDHVEQRHKIAHDLLFANYVTPFGKHYPLDFRRFKKAEQCAAQKFNFQDHIALFCELVDWCCGRGIPGAFVMDSFFTCAQTLNHIQACENPDGTSRRYVGDLKTNRKVVFQGREIKADELAAKIRPEDRKELRTGDRRQWYFTHTIRMPHVNHKVRILILWSERRALQPSKILVTNAIHWDAVKIQRMYAKRWTGTETFHRDGKQELGMGDCQLRNGQGQTRHMHLVMLAYSLLVRLIRNSHLRKGTVRLKTIGEACRAIVNENLRRTISWAVEKLREKSCTTRQIMAQLALIQ